MSANKTCGECRWCARYEGNDTSDPWLRLPPDTREQARTSWGVCALEGEYPEAMPLGQDPAEVPCDFWEER